MQDQGIAEPNDVNDLHRPVPNARKGPEEKEDYPEEVNEYGYVGYEPVEHNLFYPLERGRSRPTDLLANVKGGR